jgi:hypothetical protein
MKSDRKRQILFSIAALGVLCAGALISACGGGGEESPAPAPIRKSQTASRSFTDPPAGKNRWLPLKPGYQSVRLGGVNRGNRRLQHRRVYTVTDVTKKIAGVRTFIVLDQDFDGGQIAEQALDYLAEDKQGNVWYFGSYTEAYEGGQFVNAADAWLAGVKDAKAGIFVQGDPRVGTPPYMQAKEPGNEPDTAEVVKSGQRTCVPFKCYRRVLVIREGDEFKYYAPGVGGIKTAPASGGGEGETENLINLTYLSKRGLAELSAEALKLDKHARTEAADTFGQSAAAKRTL